MTKDNTYLNLRIRETGGMYKNSGADMDTLTHKTADWGRRLESEGRIPSTWCIMDGRIHVIGNVDLRGEKILYPFGVVSGTFMCDESELSSGNYPYKVGITKS